MLADDAGMTQLGKGYLLIGKVFGGAIIGILAMEVVGVVELPVLISFESIVANDFGAVGQDGLAIDLTGPTVFLGPIHSATPA